MTSEDSILVEPHGRRRSRPYRGVLFQKHLMLEQSEVTGTGSVNQLFASFSAKTFLEQGRRCGKKGKSSQAPGGF